MGLFSSIANIFGGMSGGNASIPSTDGAKPKFFEPGGGFETVAGHLGDLAKVAGGGQATYAPMMQRQQADARELQKLATLEAMKAQYRSPTAAQQNYEYRQRLPEADRAIFDTMIRSQNQNPYTMIGNQPYQEQPARAMLNGRTIVVRNGQWVDEATGQPVQ